MKKRILWTSILTIAVLLLTTAFAPLANAPDNVTLTVLDSYNNPLDGVKVYYNDYGSHWVLLGTTTGGTVLATFEDGSYTIKAVKDYSEQVASVVVSGTGSHSFHTQEFAVHVTDSSSLAFPGIAVAYNDYGNHYVSMGDTDGAGNAYIELFPGTYNFKATKDYSTASGATSGSIAFQTAKFTVHVTDSSGADFPGIAASYNDYGNHYLSMGNTDGAGIASIELFPGTYKFRAYKDHTEMTGDLANVTAGTEETIDFQTANAIAYVKDCDGTPLAGFKVAFNDYGNHWLTMGTTGVDGKASIELFPGVRTIRAWIDYTYEIKNLTLTPTESTIEFNPTKVNWQYSGTIKYNDYGNHWKTMTSPFYLFPGTYNFMFGTVQKQVTISGCEMNSSVLVINLKDSTGAGVLGGKAYLGVGGWPYIGDTDANGTLVYFHNGLLSNMKVRMTAPFYGGSQDSPTQDTTVNSIFNFQTSKVTIQLKDSAGALTNGGVVQAGAGGWPIIGTTGDDGTGTLFHEYFPGTFKYRMGFNGSSMEIQQDVSIPFIFQTTKAVIRLIDNAGSPLNGGKVLQGIGGWPQIGFTGDSASGEVWYELFPGTHKFRMTYNYGTEEKTQDISTPVVFQTALVKLQFSGSIVHGVGGWPAYAGPTQMLPVSHKFGFTGCGYPRQEVFFTPTAGTVFEKSMVFASLKTSTGTGLAGGDFKYRFGWGPYTTIGTTGSSGLIVYGIDGLITTTNFNVAYKGASMEKSQNIATNSCVVFNTVPVTTALFNSTNSVNLSSGATFEYRYGWGSYTTWTGPVELLPVATNMKVSYMGASVEKSQNVGTNPYFLFNTVPVTAALIDSNSNDLSGGATFEWRYGWGSYTTWTGSIELLPVATNMKVSYMGTSVEKSQNVGTNGHFLFNTVPVTAALFDSTNTIDLSSGATFEWRYGWGPYTTLTGAVELLPVATNMKVSYGGTAVEKSQNVGTNGHFLFNTGTVNSATCTQYRYGWGSYMTFTSPMQLLAVSTRFSDANGPDINGTPVSGGSIVVTCP